MSPSEDAIEIAKPDVFSSSETASRLLFKRYSATSVGAVTLIDFSPPTATRASNVRSNCSAAELMERVRPVPLQTPQGSEVACNTPARRRWREISINPNCEIRPC